MQPGRFVHSAVKVGGAPAAGAAGDGHREVGPRGTLTTEVGGSAAGRVSFGSKRRTDHRAIPE
eukprot:scaffold11986_cov127-Isochrysis_galbana.AAC.6